MELTIACRVVSNVVVLDLVGRICYLNQRLRDTVVGLLADGRRDFIFNLTDVNYIDSYGLGQLVSIWTSIRNAGGTMQLVRPGERVRKLLEITKLDTVFQISYDDATVERYLTGRFATSA